ncbi:YidH family protein [Paenarthrobacter sp. NPDC089714]|uniref:YidH family protein n=1 Tax=unclassified Paenarthrobacter TaxID=2634190 RepID=UPI003802142B
MREPAWRRTGKTPDYRFSLANERTFLAWIRTSLALLAGAVAIDQLAPNIAPQPVRLVLCVVLSVIGAGLAILSYRRWGQMEAAMRNDQALPFSRVMLFMTIVVAVAAFAFAVLILVAR